MQAIWMLRTGLFYVLIGFSFLRTVEGASAFAYSIEPPNDEMLQVLVSDAACSMCFLLGLIRAVASPGAEGVTIRLSCRQVTATRSLCIAQTVRQSAILYSHSCKSQCQRRLCRRLAVRMAGCNS